MNMSNTLIDRTKDHYMNVFALQDIVLEHGDGCYVYDMEGKEYLDCAAGIAVASLGHRHPVFLEALRTQADKLVMCTGAYTTPPKASLSEYLTTACKMDRVFICNSGTEAVEGALRLARLAGHHTKGPEAKEVIAFRNGFHGRTYGAASVTYKSLKSPEFSPYMQGVHFADFNNPESVKPLLSDKTCAIIVEVIQGEGGIHPAAPEFLQDLRTLCDVEGITLIFDEIQTGCGRTGAFLAQEHYGIQPDIMTLAKGIGSGFPVAAFLAQDKVAQHFTPGMHGTTFGGSPLACAVALAVCQEINQQDFLRSVQETGLYFMDGLEKLQRDSNGIEEIRGKGLLIGIDIALDIKKLIRALLDAGMITTQAGERTLRLTPPLIFTPEQTDEALEKIGHVLRKGAI